MYLVVRFCDSPSEPMFNLDFVISFFSSEICICNSMARSEIWDKFHECCSENGKNCTRRSRVQFAILTTTQVKFIPKFHS